jgi:pyrroloquinoline-quinone synthase
MDLSRFEAVQLLPEARHLRDIIDRATLERGWESAAAVTTLFLEGTANERRDLEPGRAATAPPPLEEHPLVKHYGLPLEHLALTRAHRSVEGDHRRAAWKVILEFVGPSARAAVVRSMEETLGAWLAYRDAVARVCGLVLGPAGEPQAVPAASVR